MEIAKQELIVHAREAASRVLRELSGECSSRSPFRSAGAPAGLFTIAYASHLLLKTGRCQNRWLWTPGSESSFSG